MGAVHGRSTGSLDGMPDSASITNAKKRLRGAWISDRAKTMAKWTFPKTASAKTRRDFARIFGRNIWEFRLKTCSGIFDGERKSGRYRVLWADAESAIVLYANKEGEACRQIYFHGDNH